MGIADLRLVAPRHFPDPQATALAAGGAEVLERARVCATLEEALAGTVLAVGFTARDREPPAPGARAARGRPGARSRRRRTAGGARLRQRDLGAFQRRSWAAAGCVWRFPANPELRLAQPRGRGAGGVLRGRLRGRVVHRGGTARLPSPRPPRTSRRSSRTGRRRWKRAATSIPARPGRLMERLRRMLARAAPERSEVKALRGMLEAFERRMRR